ncbi:uncharacterized protein BO95DRAFT_468290 [Aspergillus brunneoviolaceus CBS 621.78]|uniref:Uncharacterized protein n=1 Tax=Aspergillus brunneoviolaceus CBS 621.78 TaxID=1450534 RepID=A0ACD1FV98_9EURO|nr:hypothetical protein BO95DRAFT_468290 [Aspergillus brunneoviolaceus CBS 621.78]RAH40899.1 hypothetical protein BO95DRAFT_468290 [Aspergillus brunneoviolaceus CBS 621.78]
MKSNSLHLPSQIQNHEAHQVENLVKQHEALSQSLMPLRNPSTGEISNTNVLSDLLTAKQRQNNYNSNKTFTTITTTTTTTTIILRTTDRNLTRCPTATTKETFE